MTTRIEVPEYIRRWMLATFKKEDIQDEDLPF